MNILEQYIEALKLGEKSENTLRLYKKDIQKFMDYFKVNSVEELKDISVQGFQEFYKFQNLSPNSLNSLIRSLSAFFSWLIQSGYIEDHSFFKVTFGRSRFAKVKKVKKPVLSYDEERMLIKAGRNLQERFMIAMMLWTALRRDEISNIKMSDIHGCEILITGKGDKQAHTYLNDTLCNMLRMYLAEERKTDSEYLFYGIRGNDGKEGRLSGVSINNRVKSAALRSGMDQDKAQRITAHRLRASKITHVAVEKGILAAQNLARHESMETTKIYISTNDDFVKSILSEESKN